MRIGFLFCILHAERLSLASPDVVSSSKGRWELHNGLQDIPVPSQLI